ncbi:MAG: CPBP family glutamic-type intramembrane protease [Promethearchaeota archaeon]
MASRTLSLFKKLATPIITLAAIAFVLFIIGSPSLWVSFQPTLPWEFLENYESQWLILLGIFTVGWLIIAEVLSAIILHILCIDISQQSFLTAWKERDWYGLLVQFPCIILLEEILFRGIALFYLDQIIDYRYAVLLGAAVFAIYHLHIYLQSHQWGITFAYIGSSLLLGIILGFLFPEFGIIGAWIYHLLAVLYIYARWIARSQNESKGKKKEIRKK